MLCKYGKAVHASDAARQLCSPYKAEVFNRGGSIVELRQLFGEFVARLCQKENLDVCGCNRRISVPKIGFVAQAVAADKVFRQKLQSEHALLKQLEGGVSERGDEQEQWIVQQKMLIGEKIEKLIVESQPKLSFRWGTVALATAPVVDPFRKV